MLPHRPGQQDTLEQDPSRPVSQLCRKLDRHGVQNVLHQGLRRHREEPLRLHQVSVSGMGFGRFAVLHVRPELHPAALCWRPTAWYIAGLHGLHGILLPDRSQQRRQGGHLAEQADGTVRVHGGAQWEACLSEQRHKRVSFLHIYRIWMACRAWFQKTSRRNPSKNIFCYFPSIISRWCCLIVNTGTPQNLFYIRKLENYIFFVVKIKLDMYKSVWIFLLMCVRNNYIFNFSPKKFMKDQQPKQITDYTK